MIVPKGNTQIEVNKTIFSILKDELPIRPNSVWIDAPAGEGDWIQFAQKNFPSSHWFGLELFPPPNAETLNIKLADCSKDVSHLLPERIDGATCISGVMVFDNQSHFFGTLASRMPPGAPLIVTNDNIKTVRDRLQYLFFGTFKRFKPFYADNEGNWKIHSVESLIHMLKKSGFETLNIRYTSIYFEDWMFTPIAFLIYLIQSSAIILQNKKYKNTRLKEKLARKSFRSLLARHYILVCQKKG